MMMKLIVNVQVEKEYGSRLALESPHPGRLKSAQVMTMMFMRMTMKMTMMVTMTMIKMTKMFMLLRTVKQLLRLMQKLIRD